MSALSFLPKPIQIGAISRGATGTIRVRLTTFKGVEAADIRQFDPSGFPTRHGVEVPVADLPTLRELVDKAMVGVAQFGPLASDMVSKDLRPTAPPRRTGGAA